MGLPGTGWMRDSWEVMAGLEYNTSSGAPMSDPSPFAAIEDAVAAFRDGRIVVIVDDEDRENEGDLAVAAEKVSPAAINFMAKHGRGLVCLALTEERCRQLELPLMVESNT